MESRISDKYISIKVYISDMAKEAENQKIVYELIKCPICFNDFAPSEAGFKDYQEHMEAHHKGKIGFEMASDMMEDEGHD
jgi:hypothetical protein